MKTVEANNSRDVRPGDRQIIATKMADKNEIVIIEMVTAERLKLAEQISSRMRDMFFGDGDCDQLELGFELPAGWPVDMRVTLTLAQLCVIAFKLKMRIIITGLDMVGEKNKEAEAMQ